MVAKKTRILIYGDSNTWGDSGEGYRYQTQEQWPNILQELLGADYEVVQEGLCGRVAGDYVEDKPHRNGLRYFRVALGSASPLDLTIIALGANDLKEEYGRSAQQIAADLISYVKTLHDFSQEGNKMVQTAILFIGEKLQKSPLPRGFDNEKFRQVYEILEAAGHTVIVPPDVGRVEDDLHYSAEGHKKVAQTVYEEIRGLV